MVLDEQSIGQKIQPVLREGDAHRPRQIAGPAAKLTVSKFGRAGAAFEQTGAAAPHDRDAVPRIERAHEHRRGKARRLRHDVDQTVNAVIQVDVRMAGRTIQRLVAPGRPRRRMTGGIGLANVRFDLDDDAAGEDPAPPVHENLAQEIARDVKCRSIVESTRKLHDI